MKIWNQKPGLCDGVKRKWSKRPFVLVVVLVLILDSVHVAAQIEDEDEDRFAEDEDGCGVRGPGI